MTAVEFSPQERARLDAIEAAEPAPESLRERVARALLAEMAEVWDFMPTVCDASDARDFADAALAVVKGDPS